MSPERKKSPLSAAATLATVAHCLAEEVGKDTPLMQLRCFLVIAAAGDAGIEMEQVENRLQMKAKMDLSGQVSRSIEGLRAPRSDKIITRAGLIQRNEDPEDRRRKVVMLSQDGKRVMAKLADKLEGMKA